MATDQKMLLCKTCVKATIHLVQRSNHVLHLLLSVVTFGAWLVVWFLVANVERPVTCTVCGTRYKRGFLESV